MTTPYVGSTPVQRVHIGVTRGDGTREHHTLGFDAASTMLVETETPTEPTDPSPALLVPAEVQPMSVSADAVRLARLYMERVFDEEHPAQGIQKGYSPRELGLRRHFAHDKLMAQLAAEGIDISDRHAITLLAQRIDQWLREDA